MAMRDRQTGLYLSGVMNNLGEMTDYAVEKFEGKKEQKAA